MILFLFLLPFDRVVGIVQNNIITLSDIKTEESLYPGISDREMLRKIIEDNILLMEADSETLSVSDDEVKNAFKKFVSQNAQNPAVIGINSNPLLKKSYYRMIKQQLLIQKLIQKKFSSKIYIGEGDIRNFYEEKKDSLIVPETVDLQRFSFPIPISNIRKKKVKKRALKVMKMLENGKDFSTLAEKYSEDINTKYNGGNLGKVSMQELPKEFSDAIELRPKEYRLFKGNTGYHIILCVNKGNTYLYLKHIYFSLIPDEKEIQLAEDSMNIIRKKAILHPDNIAFKDIGELPVKGLDPALKGIVNKLKEGEISKPFSDKINVYLIKIVKRNLARLPPLQEIHEQIRQIIYSRKIQELYTNYLKRVSKKYFVKSNL